MHVPSTPYLTRRAAALKSRARQATDPEGRRFHSVRRDLAAAYIRGNGLEIGALHMPLRVTRHARVRYVDRFDVDGLRRQYPELNHLDLVDVDVIDDGETLATVADASEDFVVANHFLEHTQDPISTLENHLRVLREGGILYLAVPDKRRTFDRDREVTPLEHVLRDHAEGPAWSRSGHFAEWAGKVSVVLNGLPPEDAEKEARRLEDMDYSIHFHVWTAEALLEMVLHCRCALGLPATVEATRRNGHEFIVILRKSRTEAG